MANLISGHHILCVDDIGNPQKDDNGNFYIFDIIDNNKLCIATNYKDVQKFFNISLNEYSPASPSGTSTVQSDINEKSLSIQESTENIEKSVLIEERVKSKLQESVKWKDENSVKALIKLWQDHESLFKSSVIKNAEVWRMISEGLRQINSNWIFNATQCENKFKDLRRHYMATKDHNAQTGVQHKTCKFYNEMEEVLGMKPIIKPVATASSLKRRSSARQNDYLASQSESTSTEAYESNDNDEEKKLNGKKKNETKKTRMEHQLEAWSLAHQAEIQKREDAREKRHKESMEKKERAIKVYENFMSKLLDKL